MLQEIQALESIITPNICPNFADVQISLCCNHLSAIEKDSQTASAKPYKNIGLTGPEFNTISPLPRNSRRGIQFF